ncbi:MAG: response regulator [Glaciecola sp.]
MTHLTIDTNNTMKFDYLLVADDDIDDQELIKDALLENHLAAEKVQWVNDGEELMNVLDNTNKLPSLILLDLNMPRKDGRKALEEIKNNQQLKHIPVIIFSTSESIDDIKTCYNLGTNTYITKPHSYKELVDAMADIIRYWGARAQIVSDTAS